MSEPFQQLPGEKMDGETKLRRAVEMVRRFIKRSEEYRVPHVNLAKISRELYECWSADSKSIIQRANIKQPYGFTIIETQIPQIVNAILKERPIAKFDAHANPLFQFEDCLSDHQDSQLEDMRFPLKLLQYVKAMKLDGTAFAKVPYRYVEKDIQRKAQTQDALTGAPMLTKQPDTIVDFDGPDFDPIPMVDFFPDWAVKTPGDVQAMRGLVHRTYRSYNELKDNKNYKNVSELDQSIRTKGAGEGAAWKEPFFSDTYNDRFDRLDDNRMHIKNRDKIEVWEYWGLFDPKNDGNFVEYIITIANGDVCLRCDENFYDYKFKPFVASPNIPRDKEFFGVPELMCVKSLIKESNVLRNSRLDQVSIAVSRMYIVDRSAGIKAKSLYTRPSGIIWTNDMNGVRELPPPEIPQSVWTEMQAIQGDIQTAVGLANTPPGGSGLNKSLARSATGVQFMDQFASSRAGISLLILSETLVKPLYRIMAMTNEQYMSDDKWVKSNDPNDPNPYSGLPKEAWIGAGTFRVRTTFDTGGKQQDLQNMQLLSQILQTAEQTQPGVTNWETVFEAIGRDLVGPRFKKFIRSPQERMQLQQQQLANEQAAQGMAGARAPQPNQVSGAIPSGPAATMIPGQPMPPR